MTGPTVGCIQHACAFAGAFLPQRGATFPHGPGQIDSPKLGDTGQLGTIRFTLDGRETEVSVRDGESLLETLRERLGVRSLKNGCKPQGQCGACVAMIDGRVVTTCAMPTRKVAGKTVATLDGLAAVLGLVEGPLPSCRVVSFMSLMRISHSS